MIQHQADHRPAGARPTQYRAASAPTEKLEATVPQSEDPLLLRGQEVALVTQGHSRIGSQIITVIGAEDARLPRSIFTQGLADQGAGASPDDAVALTADVTSADTASATVAIAEDRVGPLDVLVDFGTEYSPPSPSST